MPGADMEIASETDLGGAKSPKERGTRSGGTGRSAQKDTHLTGGVSVSPMPITAGEEVTVKYNGLLAQSGADSVYLHAGFGGQPEVGTMWLTLRCYRRSQAYGRQLCRWFPKRRLDSISALRTEPKTGTIITA